VTALPGPYLYEAPAVERQNHCAYERQIRHYLVLGPTASAPRVRGDPWASLVGARQDRVRKGTIPAPVCPNVLELVFARSNTYAQLKGFDLSDGCCGGCYPRLLQRASCRGGAEDRSAPSVWAAAGGLDPPHGLHGSPRPVNQHHPTKHQYSETATLYGRSATHPSTSRSTTSPASPLDIQDSCAFSGRELG
jgi:hypothetical protein